MLGNETQSDKVCAMVISAVEAKGIKFVPFETVCKDHLTAEDIKSLKDAIFAGIRNGSIPLRDKSADKMKDDKALALYSANLLHDRLNFGKPINGNVAKSFKEPGKYKYSKNKEYKNLEVSLEFLKAQNAPAEQIEVVESLISAKQSEIDAEKKTTATVKTPDLDLLPDSVRAMIEAAQSRTGS